jgi:hypothetical protein
MNLVMMMIFIKNKVSEIDIKNKIKILNILKSYNNKKEYFFTLLFKNSK